VADLDYEAVVADMARRDTIDEGREVDPLLCAPDAVRIDTTDRSVEEIVDELQDRLG
jgi:cytidylate kinase